MINKTIIGRQKYDETINRMLKLHEKYTKIGEETARKETPQVRTLLKNWDALLVEKNILCRIVTIIGIQVRQVIIPKEMRIEMNINMHDKLGHQGINTRNEKGYIDVYYY